MRETGGGEEDAAVGVEKDVRRCEVVVDEVMLVKSLKGNELLEMEASERV